METSTKSATLVVDWEKNKMELLLKCPLAFWSKVNKEYMSSPDWTACHIMKDCYYQID